MSLLLIKTRGRAVYPEQPVKTIWLGSGRIKKTKRKTLLHLLGKIRQNKETALVTVSATPEMKAQKHSRAAEHAK